MFQSRFCLKGMIFFSFHFLFFFFLVCEQLLKGIIYPLAVKSTQVLDPVHQKERFLSSVVGSSPLPLQARFHYLSLYLSIDLSIYTNNKHKFLKKAHQRYFFWILNILYFLDILGLPTASLNVEVAERVYMNCLQFDSCVSCLTVYIKVLMGEVYLVAQV